MDEWAPIGLLDGTNSGNLDAVLDSDEDEDYELEVARFSGEGGN